MRIKLFCIAPFNWSSIDKALPAPSVGDEVVAIGEATFKMDGFVPIECWQLDGFPGTIGYGKYCFAVMPEKSADEINDLEKESIVR